MKKAEYLNKSCRQRNNVEHEEYEGVQSVGLQVNEERDKYALLEKIIAKDNMKLAFNRVRANRGAPGIDGMKVSELEQWCRENPNLITTQILKEKYKVSPVRRVEIPKPDGGVRKLGIPTVKDRLVQQSINQILQKIFEPTFSESSYGYRPNKGAKNAIRRVKTLVEEGYKYVVEMDLSKYFDRINHEILLNLLRRKIKDERVILLIKWILKSGVMENGVVVETFEGSPQGGPLSPILANIYLDVFDKEMESRGVQIVRYADDIVIFAKSERAAFRLMESARSILEGRLKLKINEEKTRVISIYSKKFKFLGFGIGKNGSGIYIQIHKKSFVKFKNKLRELTKRNQGKSLKAVLENLKVYCRGWLNYYGIASLSGKVNKIDEWLRRRLRMYIWKAWKRPKTRIINLIKMGVERERAFEWGNTRLGYWRIARSPIVNTTINNKRLIANGYYELSENYKSIRSKY